MVYQNSSSKRVYSDTISEITSVVISLMVSLHHSRQYRALMTNSGTPSFLVGTLLVLAWV